MDDVFKSFEKTVICLKTFPEFDHMTADDVEQFLSYFKRIFGILKNRRSDGQRIVVFRGKEFEASNLSIREGIKMILIAATAFLTEEENQIAGGTVVADCSNITLSLIEKIPTTETFFLLSTLNYFPVRIKQMVLLGLPSFAVALFKLIRNLLSEKLKQRIAVVKSLSDMQAPDMLTDNVLGSEEDMFMNYDERIIRALRNFQDINVNFGKIKEYESIGSFRKLEID
jgi:hypothetical protein